MARSEQLTALSVKSLAEPGRYLDRGRENGLLLQVQKGRSGTVSKGWIVRFSLSGRRREMGLGSFPNVSLAQAREAAAAARRASAEGRDPIAERRAAQAAQQVSFSAAGATAAHAEVGVVEDEQGAVPIPTLAPAAPETFRGCAEAYLAAHAPSWRNPKHRQQWASTLSTYAYPVISELHAADVTLDHVLAIIEPIWTTKTETASRLRGRIEAVLSYAIVRGYRQPPNPATWRGQLEVLLPQKTKVAPVRHHAALPYAELSGFYARLAERPAPAALALRFLILTAARSGEVRGMTWNEVDWDSTVWVVPAARMKAGEEHRVPLSAPALALLRERVSREKSDPADATRLVFPNAPGTGPMSDSVWRALFRRMGCPEITAHGFRSTFRDWCGEETAHPRELAEHALAHQVGNAVERAYRRGDALERRRVVMEDWGTFVLSNE